MGLNKARRRAHDLVLQTGNDYAYEFVKVPLLGLLEVRVLKGGKTTYTRVDPSGRPIGHAHTSIPSLKRADPRIVLAVAFALGFLGELVF